MASGFTWGVYTADDGSQHAVRVNDTYFGHVERGWVSAESLGLQPLPRQWLPRKALGIDFAGHPQTAVVPDTNALIWSGASTSFSVLGNDGSIVLCTVIGLMEERPVLS